MDWCATPGRSGRLRSSARRRRSFSATDGAVGVRPWHPTVWRGRVREVEAVLYGNGFAEQTGAVYRIRLLNRTQRRPLAQTGNSLGN